MDEQPVTRLGPDSGGRAPGEAGSGGGAGGPGVSRLLAGSGDPATPARPGLPWIGIFLLVFGGLLLLQQAFPAGSEAARLAGLLSRWSGWRSSSSGRSTAGAARCTPAR